MKFWDSSAVVPLLVAQPTSARCDGWLADDPRLAIWTLTPVEAVSALRRLVREGALAETDAHSAEARAHDLARAAYRVVEVEGVKATAVRLLRVHALRAADALQLGAALEWAAGKTAERVLHTLDERLAVAARREGFEVR